MAGGSVSYEADSVPLARPSAVILTFRYTPNSTRKFELLPNIKCLGVQWRKGSDPPGARFRYTFQGPWASEDDPRRLEDVYPLDASGPHVVHTDDRLVVVAVRDDGYHETLFDGYAEVPQGDLGPATEMVTFTALGTPVREFDAPLSGALMRDADAPASVSDQKTDRPIRFNPDGKPNASPVDGDAGEAGATYPTLIGPVSPSNKINGETLRPWTLPMAVKYCIAQGNPDQNYVQYDQLNSLDDLLVTYKPVDEEDLGIINIDEGLFETEDIEVQDIDVTGSAWPEAVVRLTEPHGFGFRWILFEGEPDQETGLGEPQWGFSLWREDVPFPVKQLKLQSPDDVFLDPALTNLGGLSLARDTHDIANVIAIDSAPLRIEASFVLAPAFAIDASDVSNKANFVETNLDVFTGANRDKYRVFILDECGEGHWDANTSSWSEAPADLKLALQFDEKDRNWVKRRRPATGYNLLSLGENGKPLRARLDVSGNYTGPEPGVWDASASHWQRYTGEWQLLDDRLGVRLLCNDPDDVPLRVPANTSSADFTDNKLNIVQQLCTPGTDATPKARIRFRLTCVIEADHDMDVKADRRAASPTRFKVQRRVDARDRFAKTIVTRWSALGDPAKIQIEDTIVRNDAKEAQAYVDGVRRAREAGKFAGMANILRLSTAYRIGDKISRITGRNLSLRTNVGAEAGEGPIYPTVIGVSWNFDGEQTTTLELTDNRAMPAPKKRRDLEIHA